MPNTISTTGITTATQAELSAFYTAALQTIFGADINIGSSTPDGQLVNIFIQSVLDIEDLITQVYNTFDPDNAIGVVLDQRVAINGIQRQAGTYTTTNVTIVASQSVNLYGINQSAQPIFTVADNAGNQWQLITSQLGISAGSHVYLFQAANPGQVLTVPNTITVPVTIVLGVTSINNPTTYSTLGINEETDMALKIRRQKSTSLASQGFYQGLTAALDNINGINSAFVHENDGSTVDTTGTPGHSIWVIVSGSPNIPLSTAYNSGTSYSYGNIASSGGINYISVANSNTGNSVSNPAFWNVYNPIAQAIYNYRNAGCGMYNSGDAGAQSYTITQIDGSFFNVYWETVIAEPVFLKFTATSLNGVNPPNISAIISGLVADFQPAVNEEININQVSTTVQAKDPNTLATGSGFSISAGGTYTNTLKPVNLNYQFSIQASNIIILPIILACPNGTAQFTLLAGGSYQVNNVTVSTTTGGTTIQFAPVGGYGSMVYSLDSGPGAINSSTGLYTSSSAGIAVVRVTDALTNTAIATVTVT